MWRFIIIALALTPCIPCQETDPNRALFEGHQLTAAQVTDVEAAIQANPDDWQDRVRLLGFYATQLSASSNTAQTARLQQILWLIEHRPDLTVLHSPDAAIPFLTTRNVAVMGGLEEAKQAWRQALATHSDDWRVLGNAAWFFRIKDKDQSVDLLRRALAASPGNRMLADQLGAEYALILLGVTAFDPSGRPSHFDPAEASSPLAQTVRAELKQSPQAPVLYAAGSTLSDYRADVTKSGGVEDSGALATNLIERAKALDPNLVPTRIRVGGNIQAANLVTKVAPVYPPMAKQARIQGTVRFAAVLGKDGSVVNLQLISGHPLLVAPAQDAVKQWVYKPTLLNGAPVEVLTQIDVNFTLTQPQPAAESDILNK